MQFRHTTREIKSNLPSGLIWQLENAYNREEINIIVVNRAIFQHQKRKHNPITIYSSRQSIEGERDERPQGRRDARPQGERERSVMSHNAKERETNRDAIEIREKCDGERYKLQAPRPQLLTAKGSRDWVSEFECRFRWFYFSRVIVYIQECAPAIPLKIVSLIYPSINYTCV